MFQPCSEGPWPLTLPLSFLLQDTEFPGVVVRPIGEFRSTVDYQYQLLRCNVDLLKIIQLGLSFMNEDGGYPPGTTTWQFNFKFNLTYVHLETWLLSRSLPRPDLIHL